jgi:hypothetical protein
MVFQEKKIHCRRGIRQGDPLSSLLFVLVADLLQSIVNKAMNVRILNLSIDVGYTSGFPILQYVDDTLLIMEACPRQLFALKAILNTFAIITCLKVNYFKSRMVPINVPRDRLQHMADTFQCQAGALPFTYLGLPLSLSKPTLHDCWIMVQRVEKRLISTTIFLC